MRSGNNRTQLWLPRQPDQRARRLVASLEGECALQQHLPKSRYIFGCRNQGSRSETYWVKARDAGKDLSLPQKEHYFTTVSQVEELQPRQT